MMGAQIVIHAIQPKIRLNRERKTRISMKVHGVIAGIEKLQVQAMSSPLVEPSPSFSFVMSPFNRFAIDGGTWNATLGLIFFKSPTSGNATFVTGPSLSHHGRMRKRSL